MSGEVDLSAFRGGFVVEADEHIATASHNLLEVEADLKKGQPSPRAVRELYRALHTIKGMAAMVGVEPVVEIAHAMESVLRAGDRAGGRLPEPALDLLARGIAAIEHRVAAVASDSDVAAAPPGLLESLGGLEPPPALAAGDDDAVLALPGEIADKLTPSDRGQLASLPPGRRVVRLDFAPSPARAAEGLNITVVRERVGRLGDIVKVLPLSRPRDEATPGGLVFALLVITAADDAALSQAAGDAPLQSLPRPVRRDLPEEETLPLEETQPARGVIRVEVGRLDDALEKLTALVVTRSRMSRAVSELAARAVDVRALQQVVGELGRQLRELRASIMKARMVSAAQTFDRLPLLVRGLSRSTGKGVGLELDTGHAELDKAVAERLFPAIIHLLRNAVDHAVEDPAVRERAGKPGRATIRVTCRPRANNQLEVLIEDDGRGIDVAGLAAQVGREAPTSEEGLLGLLCTPGLSSLRQATTTSGRGMGMNIVRQVVVEELGGEIGVRTRPGQGTTFCLRIPLSITIMDAFSFRCGSQPFVVPVSAVEEVVEVDPALVTRAPSGEGRAELRMLERRGAAVPLVSLERIFRLEAVPGLLRKAIVVKRNGQPFGFEVDQMLGQQEVVVRPLEDPLVRQPGIVGSTDLGDGQPTLVLDLVSLSGRVSRRRTDVRS
jgi:two-component system chemotaxis sensor kinase CheA